MDDTQKTDLARMEEFLAKAVEAGDSVVVVASGEDGITMSSNCLGRAKDVVGPFYRSLHPQRQSEICYTAGGLVILPDDLSEGKWVLMREQSTVMQEVENIDIEALQYLVTRATNTYLAKKRC